MENCSSPVITNQLASLHLTTTTMSSPTSSPILSTPMIIPETPGKRLQLPISQFGRIPLKNDRRATSTPVTEDAVDASSSSYPTPGQTSKISKNRTKITLSDHAKCMVWGELGKIKSVRKSITKVSSFEEDLKTALANDKIPQAFAISKNIPQIAGGDPSWGFRTEWQKALDACSKNLMQITCNFITTERTNELTKKAQAMATAATADLDRALPCAEKIDGLELFKIVNNSMQRTRNHGKVKVGRVTKKRKTTQKTLPKKTAGGKKTTGTKALKQTKRKLNFKPS